jgi:hypothetical protein
LFAFLQANSRLFALAVKQIASQPPTIKRLSTESSEPFEKQDQEQEQATGSFRSGDQNGNRKRKSWDESTSSNHRRSDHDDIRDNDRLRRLFGNRLGRRNNEDSEPQVDDAADNDSVHPFNNRNGDDNEGEMYDDNTNGEWQQGDDEQADYNEHNNGASTRFTVTMDRHMMPRYAMMPHMHGGRGGLMMTGRGMGMNMDMMGMGMGMGGMGFMVPNASWPSSVLPMPMDFSSQFPNDEYSGDPFFVNIYLFIPFSLLSSSAAFRFPCLAL